MVDVNKNSPWFRTAARCQYSNLPVSHPEFYISKHLGSNYFVDIARLGDQILLVKGFGNVRSYEMTEAMNFMDNYVSKYFDIKTGAFIIEDYIDIGRADSKARKIYIDHHKNSATFWGGIFYWYGYRFAFRAQAIPCIMLSGYFHGQNNGLLI